MRETQRRLERLYGTGCIGTRQRVIVVRERVRDKVRRVREECDLIYGKIRLTKPPA
jgi:hypothetical protein